MVCHTLTNIVTCMQTAWHMLGAPHADATGCLARPKPSWLLSCRQKAAEKAKMLLAAGQVKEAATAFSGAVVITADMAHELVVQLQLLGIDFIVSPYEADSQLAFLSLVRPSAAVAPVLLYRPVDLAVTGQVRHNSSGTGNHGRPPPIAGTLPMSQAKPYPSSTWPCLLTCCTGSQAQVLPAKNLKGTHCCWALDTPQAQDQVVHLA